MVARCFNNRSRASLCDRQEMMARASRSDCVDCNLNVALGSIFKANRTLQARGELTMVLTFCCPRTDRTPGHQVRDILRRNGI